MNSDITSTYGTSQERYEMIKINAAASTDQIRPVSIIYYLPDSPGNQVSHYRIPEEYAYMSYKYLYLLKD